MKKFKVLFLVAMLSTTAMTTAQTTSFGIKGGLGMSDFGGGVEGAKARVGFNVGITADYEFKSNMSIQSGLSFITKGANMSEGNSFVGLNYLQFPVYFAYKTAVSPATRIVFQAGPYAAYGIGGKTKYEEAGESISDDSFGRYGDVKRFDAGLGLGIGVDFGHFIVGLGWDMGLLNIYSYPDEGKVNNQSGYLSVEFKF